MSEYLGKEAIENQEARIDALGKTLENAELQT
jgi:hypothetical protein